MFLDKEHHTAKGRKLEFEEIFPMGKFGHSLRSRAAEQLAVGVKKKFYADALFKIYGISFLAVLREIKDSKNIAVLTFSAYSVAASVGTVTVVPAEICRVVVVV